jgi:hypothetical protein
MLYVYIIVYILVYQVLQARTRMSQSLVYDAALSILIVRVTTSRSEVVDSSY